MIFPHFDNVELIDQIRNKYDPLANLVRPHITIVFSFESSMSNEELSQILEVRLQAIRPFFLELGGVSKHEDDFGNYLFLDVIKGAEEIKGIHRILYENEFKEYDLGYPYIPHMTIGKLPTPKLLASAYDDVKGEKSHFATMVCKISVEMIGDGDESIIVVEKELR